MQQLFRPRAVVLTLTLFTLCIGGSIPAAARRASTQQPSPQTLPSVRGRVVMASSDPIAPGVLSRIRVYVWLASDDKLRTRIDVGLELDTLPPAATPGPDGRFEIPNLVPGLYKMRVSRLPRGWSASAKAGAVDLLKAPFEITHGAAALQDVVVTLTDKPAGQAQPH